ncbi:MAG: alpha/beta hydrolase [Candidatus Cryptobacteroides sp.]
MAVIGLASCTKGVENSVESGNDGNETESVIQVEEIWCGEEGSRIFGKMYLPESTDGNLPVVILSHSNSLTHEAMAGYADSLAVHGYASYCFDFRGGSSDSRSQGNVDDVTLFTEIEDLKTVFGTISSLDYVDKDRIYLMGSSLGGVVSALVAEDMPEKVAGLILFYPAFNISSIVNKFTDYPGVAGTAFTESLKDYEIMDHIGEYPGPVLIIQGTKDFIVPTSVAEEAAAKYDDVELHLIDGANHGFNEANLGSFGSLVSGNYDAVVMPFVYAWLTK